MGISDVGENVSIESKGLARTIRRKVSRLAWRIRVQSAVRWSLWCAAVAFGMGLVALALYQAWLLPPAGWSYVGYGIAGLTGLGLLAGLLRRFDRVRLAQRIDDANDLKDRLGTALRLLEKDEPTEFEQAQIRDAAKYAVTVDHRPAARWVFPTALGWVAASLAAAWGLTYATMAPPSGEHAGLRPVFFGEALALVPTRLAGPPPVDPYQEDVIADIHEAIEANTETLEPLAADDAESLKFISELNKALEDLAEGELDDRQLMERAQDLSEKLESLAGDKGQQEAFEDQAENLEKLGEALEKEAEKLKENLQSCEEGGQCDKQIKEKIQELAKLLQDRKYEEASKLAEELLEKFMKMSPKDQERLAKMFEKLANKFQSKLGKDIERLKQKRDRLQRQADNRKNGPSKRQRDRLNRMNKQLDRMQREKAEKQSEQRKNLDQLSREMKDLANRMRRQKPKRGQEKGQKNQAQQRKQRLTQQQIKRLKQMMRRMQRQQRRQRLKRSAKHRVADLKELMRRKRNMGKGKGGKQLSRLRRGRKGKNGKGEKGQGELRLGKGDPKRGVEWMKGTAPGDQDTKVGGVADGAGVGHSRNRMLQGKATDIEGKAVEDFVAGKHGKGESMKEVLYGAARQGAEVKGYGEAHIDYSMRAAEQMEEEQVPPGYREYVEEYFRLIQQRRSQ